MHAVQQETLKLSTSTLRGMAFTSSKLFRAAAHRLKQTSHTLDRALQLAGVQPPAGTCPRLFSKQPLNQARGLSKARSEASSWFKQPATYSCQTAICLIGCIQCASGVLKPQASAVQLYCEARVPSTSPLRGIAALPQSIQTPTAQPERLAGVVSTAELFSCTVRPGFPP